MEDDVKAYKQIFRQSIRFYRHIDISLTVLTTIFGFVTGVSAFSELDHSGFQYFLGGMSIATSLTAAIPQSIGLPEKLARLKVGYLTCSKIIHEIQHDNASDDQLQEQFLQVEELTEDVPSCLL